MPSEPDPFTMSLVLMATFSSLAMDIEGEQQEMPLQTDCATVPTSVRARTQLDAHALLQPDGIEKAECSSEAQVPQPEMLTEAKQPLRKAARPQQLSDLKLAKELQQRCAKEHRRQAALERRAQQQEDKEREAAVGAEAPQEVAEKVASPDVELQVAFPQEVNLPAALRPDEVEQQIVHQELEPLAALQKGIDEVEQQTVLKEDEAEEEEQQQQQHDNHQVVLKEAGDIAKHGVVQEISLDIQELVSQHAAEVDRELLLQEEKTTVEHRAAEVDGSWEVVPEASFHDVLLDRVDIQGAEEDWQMVFPHCQSGV